MCATSAITAIGAAHSRKFITHKMPAACAAVAASAENPDLINKIAFFQVVLFLQRNANIPCHEP